MIRERWQNHKIKQKDKDTQEKSIIIILTNQIPQGRNLYSSFCHWLSEHSTTCIMSKSSNTMGRPPQTYSKLDEPIEKKMYRTGWLLLGRLKASASEEELRVHLNQHFVFLWINAPYITLTRMAWQDVKALLSQNKSQK